MSKIRITIAACIMALSLLNVAQAKQFAYTIDKYDSPFMGANWMQSGLNAYELLDDTLLSSTEDQMCVSITLARSAKWLFEYSLSNLAMVVQHEVFGHGARAREFHLPNIGYRIGVFSGTTTYASSAYHTLNAQQRAAFKVAGIEATSILAQQIERSWFPENTIDSRAATMFLVNTLDQSVYMFSTTSDAFHPDNDIHGYISTVNSWYGYHALKVHSLKTRMVWDWLDPMIYMSAYSILKYIWQGQQFLEFDMLQIGEAHFMPTPRTLFAPWGTEFQLQNHIYTPEDKYIGVYARYGKNGNKSSHGLDLHIAPINPDTCWYFTHKLSAWRQPHLLQNDTGRSNTNKYGFAYFLGANYRLNQDVYATGELGYKLSGYLPGVQLERGLIWRVGLKMNLDVVKAKKSTQI